MCMICNVWNKDENTMSYEQAITNLFETKESLGKDHAREVLRLIINNAPQFPNSDDGINKYNKMLLEIERFIGLRLQPIVVNAYKE